MPVLALVGTAALALTFALAFAAAAFATVPALDLRMPAEIRLGLWVRDAAHWTVAAGLFLLAAVRLRDRPGDAWLAAVLGAIVITVASVNAHAVPRGLLLAATIAGALAPWLSLAYPPSRGGFAVVGANLAVIAALPLLATLVDLPFWLKTFVTIDPLTIPAWLAALPLQWPWIVVAAPVTFDAFGLGPEGCCRLAPSYPALFLYGPAALIGLVIWVGGRGRTETEPGLHGRAGSALRRG